MEGYHCTIKYTLTLHQFDMLMCIGTIQTHYNTKFEAVSSTLVSLCRAYLIVTMLTLSLYLLIDYMHPLGVVPRPHYGTALRRVCQIPQTDDPVCSSSEHHRAVVYDAGRQASHTVMLLGL